MDTIVIFGLVECLLIGILIGLVIAVIVHQTALNKLDKELKLLDDILNEMRK